MKPKRTRATFVNITSCKGGVGKSTIALFLAHVLARRGRPVFVLDLDLSGSNLAEGLGEALDLPVHPPDLHDYLCMILDHERPGTDVLRAIVHRWRHVTNLHVLTTSVSPLPRDLLAYEMEQEHTYGRLRRAVFELCLKLGSGTRVRSPVFILDHEPGLGERKLGYLTTASAWSGNLEPYRAAEVAWLNLHVCSDDRQDLIQTYFWLAAGTQAVARKSGEVGLRERIRGMTAILFNRVRTYPDLRHPTDPMEFLDQVFGGSKSASEWQTFRKEIGPYAYILDSPDYWVFYPWRSAIEWPPKGLLKAPAAEFLVGLITRAEDHVVARP